MWGDNLAQHRFKVIFQIQITAPHSWLGFLSNHLQSTVFMSLPNPILQWNPGYLQTDIPALQVFDQTRGGTSFIYFFSVRPLLAGPHTRSPAAAPSPASRRAGPAQDLSLPVRVGGRFGLRAAPQQVTLTARVRVRKAASWAAGLRGRSCEGWGGGVARLGGFRLPEPRLRSPEGRLRCRWAPRQRGRRPGASATQGRSEERRDGLTPGPQDREPERGPHGRLLTPRASCRGRRGPGFRAPSCLSPSPATPSPRRGRAVPGPAAGRTTHAAAPQAPPFPAMPPPPLRLRAARGSQRTHLPSPAPPSEAPHQARGEGTDLCSPGRRLGGWKDGAGLPFRRFAAAATAA